MVRRKFDYLALKKDIKLLPFKVDNENTNQKFK